LTVVGLPDETTGRRRLRHVRLLGWRISNQTGEYSGVIGFNRDAAGFPEEAADREWLVTSGTGGYAAGTVSGLLARSYHGLLVAATDPPVGRRVLVTKVEETASCGGKDYRLFSNRWDPPPAPLDPDGMEHLESFWLDGTVPVWRFRCGAVLLEKRVWMEQGADVTFMQYLVIEAASPVTLSLGVYVTDRDHHAVTDATVAGLHAGAAGDTLRVSSRGINRARLQMTGADVSPDNTWYRGVHLAVEGYRGLPDREDLYRAGTFTIALPPGKPATLLIAAGAESRHDATQTASRIAARDLDLLARSSFAAAPAWIRRLVLAADQFIVARDPGAGPGSTVIAGYHWFGDWGRDTMIALPGLTLATGRPEVAARILRTFARFVDRGMLPNRFPDEGEVPEYNTIDATLWYFEAIRAYHAATGDGDLVQELYPVLARIVDVHFAGTRYGIGVDPADGLLRGGEPGVQLTWMDAMVDGWVVTPRIGKPVEVNALWYHALRTMGTFSSLVGEAGEPYEAAAARVAKGFDRFWNAGTGYCYDVIDGPEGNDPVLRPNQIIAASLRHSPLAPDRQAAVVDACARRLVTPRGLRSLDPDHPDFVGRYGGERRARDGAYHRGTVWAWLIGPFVRAHLRVHRDPDAARAFLEPFASHLLEQCLGTLGEIADGAAPHTPRGAVAQAWSVAEVLRAWRDIDDFEEAR
jgi:predicted glycogen debranching enzyme